MVTVGSILRGTFQFARSNIPAILVWGAVFLVTSLLMLTLMMRPIYEAQLVTLQAGTNVMPSFGLGFWLAFPVMTILFLALWAAVFRAVLFPAESRFFYLRFGMDELRLLGLMLLLILAMIVLEVVGVVGIILVAGLLSLLLGKAAGVAVGVVMGLALFCFFIWVAIRILPAGPLTLLERKIMIAPAWRLSRGHFWRLFGAYLVITLVLIAVYFVLILVQMGPIMGDMLRPTDPDAARRVAEWHVAQLQLGVSLVVYSIVSSLIGSLSLALQAGMAAVATRDLLASQAPAAGEGPWS